MTGGGGGSVSLSLDVGLDHVFGWPKHWGTVSVRTDDSFCSPHFLPGHPSISPTSCRVSQDAQARRGVAFALLAGSVWLEGGSPSQPPPMLPSDSSET